MPTLVRGLPVHLPVAFVMPMALGCATISLGPKQLVESEAKSTRVERVQSWTATGEVQRQGDTVRVFAVKACHVHDQAATEVEQTYAQERSADGVDPRLLYSLAAIGGLGLGSYLYFDAESISASSRRRAMEKGSTDYTSVGSAQTAGGAFAGIGLVAAVVVLIDTIRLAGSETSTETVTQRGALSAPLGDCGEVAYAGAAITSLPETGAVALGSADEQGVLALPLSKIVPAANGSLTPIAVEGVEVGHWPR